MKLRRMNRIFAPDNRALVLAMDHGAIAGPMAGLETVEKGIETAVAGAADGILLQPGALEKAGRLLPGAMGAVMRLTGGFTLLTDPQNFQEHLVSTVEDALRLGADAVAVTIKYGHPQEGEFIAQAGMTAAACRAWNLPLMIEVMPKGERAQSMGQADSLILACRAAAELGADIIKAPYPGDKRAMARLAETCGVPVLILGGEKRDDAAGLVDLTADALEAGAAGLCMGRNLFGHKKAGALVKYLADYIHHRLSREEAGQAVKLLA